MNPEGSPQNKSRIPRMKTRRPRAHYPSSITAACQRAGRWHCFSLGNLYCTSLQLSLLDLYGLACLNGAKEHYDNHRHLAHTSNTTEFVGFLRVCKHALAYWATTSYNPRCKGWVPTSLHRIPLHYLHHPKPSNAVRECLKCHVYAFSGIWDRYWRLCRYFESHLETPSLQSGRPKLLEDNPASTCRTAAVAFSN